MIDNNVANMAQPSLAPLPGSRQHEVKREKNVTAKDKKAIII